MNKFKEYIDRLWDEFMKSEESFGVEHDEAFEKGFNSALALDLPVKFAEWKVQECTLNNFTEKNWMFDGKWWSSKELYQYWIDNIYKPK